MALEAERQCRLQRLQALIHLAQKIESMHLDETRSSLMRALDEPVHEVLRGVAERGLAVDVADQIALPGVGRIAGEHQPIDPVESTRSVATRRATARRDDDFHSRGL